MVVRGLELHGTAGGHLFPQWSHVLLASFLPLSPTRFMDMYVMAGAFCGQVL